MGVNTKILINSKARLKDVANVMGILAGLEATKIPFQDNDGYYIRVNGVKTESCEHMPECCMINLIAPEGKTLIDGEKSHFVMWHWETFSDFHLMMPRSSGFWIAMGKALIEIFGGQIDFNDCDDIDVDMKSKGKFDSEDYLETNEAFYKMQEFKLNLKSLTKKDLDNCYELSAYNK